MRAFHKSWLFVISMLVIVVIGLSIVLATHLQSKATISPDYDMAAVQIERVDFSYLYEQFDSIEVLSSEDDSQKVVATTFKLAGSNLSDVVFTSDKESQNIAVSGLTKIDTITNEGEVNLVLDYGNGTSDNVFASSNVEYIDGEFVGTVEFDGVTYDVREILESMGADGTQECWFWIAFRIVFVIVDVLVTAIAVYDIYKYLTSEEVTVEGLLCVVVEGFVMVAAGSVAGFLGGKLLAKGAKLIKKGKKLPKNKSEYTLGRSLDELLNESVSAVKDGKRSIKVKRYACNGDNGIRKDYQSAYGNRFKFAAKYKNDNDYVEIHHFVEQRQIENGKFKAVDIHTDLNTVGIPKSLHKKISGFYSSTTAHLEEINKILKGTKYHFDGTTRFRDYVGKFSYEEQYEIGVKLFKHLKGSKDFALRL